MNVRESILQILRDELPLRDGFTNDEFDAYIDLVDTINDKVSNLLPSKVLISETSIPKPDTPLWLWHKGSKNPILANYRDDHQALFWPIIDGDYINNSNSIPLNRATHFMYINKPEEY